jgi:hypothetical protein
MSLMSSFQVGGGECIIKNGELQIDHSIATLLVRFFTTSKIRTLLAVFSLSIILFVPAPVSVLQRFEALGIMAVVGAIIALLIRLLQKLVKSFDGDATPKSYSTRIPVKSIESVELDDKWPYPKIHIHHTQEEFQRTTTLQFPTKSHYEEQKGAAKSAFEDHDVPISEK